MMRGNNGMSWVKLPGRKEYVQVSNRMADFIRERPHMFELLVKKDSIGAEASVIAGIGGLRQATVTTSLERNDHLF